MSGGTLFVASPGGHVEELYELFAHRVGAGQQWVTSRTPQTTSLLKGRDVAWARPVGSRQWLAMLASMPQVWSTIRRTSPTRLVSTGAALSVPYLILARLLGIECLYIESATRLDGPSVTGRIAERIPGIRLRTQTNAWQRPGWELGEGVFDGYVAVERTGHLVRSVLVTVGTERFPFPRMLQVMDESVAEGLEVTWQTGHTQVTTALPGTHCPWWTAVALREAAQAADLVVTHAGVGSILMALRAGRRPVLVPRRADLHEHVDNHQVELAYQLRDRGLAVVAEPGQPLRTLLDEAAAYIIERRVARTPAS